MICRNVTTQFSLGAYSALLFGLSISTQTFAQSSQMTDKDITRVCKAAISKVMGRDVKIFRTDKFEEGIAYVSYVRPDDNKQWKNRCRLEGDRVVWSTVDAFGPNSGFGAWRTRPQDERINYRLEGGSISIIEISSDGSKTIQTLVVN